MKPFLALIATNHETVVMRLSTDTPQPVRIIFIFLRFRAFTAIIIVIVVIQTLIIFILFCKSVEFF
jgi:hypothetical protein